MQESTDVPVVALQVRSEHMRLIIPSLPHWIEPTVDYLRQKAILCGACQEPRAGKLFVALLEALSNAVIHGNLEISSDLKECGDHAFARALAERSADPHFADRVVDIVFDYDGEVCRWVMTDEGPGFDVARILARCLSDDPEIMLASGRGILMMHSFLDGVHYDRDGRQVTMMLRRASGEEKRRTTRVPVVQPVRVAPVSADGNADWSAAYDAVSRDLSPVGAALIQEQLVEGQRIVIAITTDGQTIHVPAEVRHCRTLASGSIEIGCAFHVKHSEQPAGADPEQIGAVHQAIAAILARHAAPELPGHERREHPRVVFNRTITVEIAGRAEPVSGYARDLSKGGLALITRVALTQSAAVVVLPRDDAAPVRIRAAVVRCNRIQESFYDVGLRFLQLERASD